MSSVTKPPSYQRWLRKAYWCLDEAVSLLLGIDPKGRSAAFEDPAVCDEYLDLLDSALRSEKRDLSIISIRTHETLMGTAYARVEPTEIVRWAQRSGYPIPPELQSLLESDEPENTDLDATPELQTFERVDEPPREREIEAGSEFHNTEESGEKPSAYVDRPVRTRERRTMLVIMEILARVAKIDTTKPYAAAETIKRAAEMFGLTIDTKTIAKKLEEIPDALESRKQ